MGNQINTSVKVNSGNRFDWRQNPWPSRQAALDAITGTQRIFGQRIPCMVGDVYIDHWFVGGFEDKHFVVADNTIGQEDALIYAGTTFDDTAETVTLDASKWRISDVTYTLQTPVTYEIPEADATLLRQDIVVGDYNGQVNYIEGTAGVTAVQPTIPYKNILITSFIVSAADGITEVPETPEQDGAPLNGTTDPTPTTGKTDDSYLNTVSGEMFWKELVDGVSTWVSKYTIAAGEPGPQGEPGEQGPAGNDGATGSTGAAGPGVPAGGTTGQRLAKIDGTDYNTQWVNHIEAYSFAVSDETTALTVGTAKISFRMPYAFTLSSVRASLNEAPAGSNFIVNIKDSGTTIFSTNLTIDSGELTSTTAATPAVLSDTALADDALITVDIVQVGSTTAGKGLKISFIGTKS